MSDRVLRDGLIAALNQNPVTLGLAGDILDRWDELVAAEQLLDELFAALDAGDDERLLAALERRPVAERDRDEAAV